MIITLFFTKDFIVIKICYIINMYDMRKND